LVVFGGKKRTKTNKKVFKTTYLNQ